MTRKSAMVHKDLVYLYPLNSFVCYGVSSCLYSRNSSISFTEPRIHAFVYEPTTGEATRLPIDFVEHMKELREVYDLYHI